MNSSRSRAFVSRRQQDGAQKEKLPYSLLSVLNFIAQTKHCYITLTCHGNNYPTKLYRESVYLFNKRSDTIKYLKKVLRGLEPMRYPTGKVLLNIITEYNNRLSNH